MKFLKSSFVPIILLSALLALQACHTKKKVIQQQPPPDTAKATPPPPPPQPAPPPPPPPQKPVPPNYNFSNVQFDFDSSILKTSSYPELDKMAEEMKKDTTVRFNVNGYASIEGTPQHNMVLSQDRANAVKTYLVNTGVRASQLDATGYGTSNPVADNSTEEGRILNRRVEVRKQ